MEEEFKENVAPAVEPNGVEQKKEFKEDGFRFEFALFINEFLICKRGFWVNGYVEGSMQTPEFKDEVDKIVELIDEDLKSKSRVWTWYHHWPEHPEIEPELTSDPLIDEGECVFKFVIYDYGREVISKIWDGRFYPSYVRKNVDLTNRQIKITKDDRTVIYDKESYFSAHGSQLSGDMYVLKAMISEKDNLIPMIQKQINEVCSSFDGFYEKSSDYHTVVDYKNSVLKFDENGNVIKKTLTVNDGNGDVVDVLDAFGNPWEVPVTERVNGKSKKYNFNIEKANAKLVNDWGTAVSQKTKKYMKELYINPKDKYLPKKS